MAPTRARTRSYTKQSSRRSASCLSKYGKSEAQPDDLEPGIRSGTSLQTGQSVRPSSEPSRTRHQRGTIPRTHSWCTRTNRRESSFGITFRPTNQTPSATGWTGDNVLRQIRNSCSMLGQLLTSAENEEIRELIVRGVGPGVRCWGRRT